MNIIKNNFWILPFFSFIAGYILFSLVFGTHSTVTPTLIGKTLEEGMSVLSHLKLNARLLAEKEDAELLPGTIINQLPAAGTSLKTQQPVFLTITKKAPPMTAPAFLNKTIPDIEKQAHELGIIVKYYTLPTIYPSLRCFAQIPAPGQPIADQKVIVYSAEPDNKPLLMPDLSKEAIADIISFFNQEHVQVEIVHRTPITPTHTCDCCIVVDQRPLPGSFIDPSNPPSIRLYAMNH